MLRAETLEPMPRTDEVRKLEHSTEADANDGTGPLGLRALAQNRCVVCGLENPHGLRIQYVRERDGAITAEWRPTESWEGFEGIVHGGIVSTVLDEAMSKAVAAMNCEALTGELKVRFRRYVVAGENLRIRGWVVAKVKRLVQAEATLTAADGSERAHAWARFLALPGQGVPNEESRPAPGYSDRSAFVKENCT
jgi:acyl-coenzyme A thioesterase PaaI-like protein